MPSFAPLLPATRSTTRSRTRPRFWHPRRRRPSFRAALATVAAAVGGLVVASGRFRTTMTASALSITPPPSPQQLTRRIVWHRTKDLRFRDHPFYDNDPAAIAPPTTSVFLFDDDAGGCGVVPSTCRPTEWKAVRLGPHGLRVLRESVADLRRQSRGRSDLTQELVVRRGPTVPVLVELVRELVRLDAQAHNLEKNDAATPTQPSRLSYEVCWNEEPGWHEARLSREVQSALAETFGDGPVDVRVRTDLSCTLYHPDDLPKPGEWQPLSKKEKRRKQNQQRRQQQQQQQQKQPQPQRAKDATSNHPHPTTDQAVGQEFTIDVSPDRWVGMPRIMGDFRRIAREKAGVRPCREAPAAPPSSATTSLPRIDPGRMPTLEELLQPLLDYLDDDANYAEQPVLGLPAGVIRTVCQNSLAIHHQNLRRQRDDGQNPSPTTGGETAGLAHLDRFCRHHLHHAQRSLACVDDHQSSHLSHYLAFGCLSPRTVVRAAEAAINARHESNPADAATNDGTWLISHMTMRDFFLYTCLASGDRFYGLAGIPVNTKAAAAADWRSFGSGETDRLWNAWATGATGLPLVDAALAELLATGYCSNRVRQNAASLLTKDLRIDWRAGAEWFQFLLADHCVGANWGNWLYFSGVGPDPKQRRFCTVSQALRYDPEGAYVQKWLPELRRQTPEGCLRPWDSDPGWPPPVVDPETQFTQRDLQKLRETGRLVEED